QQDVNGLQSISKTLMLQWSAITVLQVYPNPAANGFVQVNNSKAGVLQFFNAAGALVKQVLVSAGKNTIDISSLAKGYHILVIGEGKASLIIK
ncbi:MAG TPA: T9SS type A sorting domain-containing protein, partial [Flavihumibacter sp.]